MRTTTARLLALACVIALQASCSVLGSSDYVGKDVDRADAATEDNASDMEPDSTISDIEVLEDAPGDHQTRTDSLFDVLDSNDLSQSDSIPDATSDADSVPSDLDAVVSPDTDQDVQIDDVELTDNQDDTLSDVVDDDESMDSTDMDDGDIVSEIEEVDVPVVEPQMPPSVQRVLPWPGGGLQILMEIPPDVESLDDLPDIWLDNQFESYIKTQTAPAGLSTGLTAILIVPSGDEQEHTLRKALADAILDALPQEEMVAVLVAREAPVLLSELSLARSHAHSQVATLVPEADRSAAPVMAQLRVMMKDLESKYSHPARAILVVGESVPELPAGIQRPVQTLSVGQVLEPQADAQVLVDQLMARRAAIVRVGSCPGFSEGQPFRLHLGDAQVMLEAPEPIEHLSQTECQASASSLDEYPYPSEIDFVFTAAERMLYDQYYATLSQEEFTTSVVLGEGSPITAVAHFHGQGTMYCTRKSITVTLDGPRRRLMPDFASDRFILISMCQDDRYYGQVFGNMLLARLGLFPAGLKFVRVRVDGVNKGVYMLVYQAERAYRDTSLGLFAVMRRLYDIEGQLAEVKYVSGVETVEAELAYFESIGEMGYSGPPETLEADLEQRLDIDNYMRLLGAYTLLMNGDFIDESFFAGSLEDGVKRYRVMGWDNDDLVSDCHAGGVRAIDDACGLTYCTEAKVDYALLRSPAIYERFLQGLQDVLSILSPELLVSTMAEVQSQLFALLSDDETAAALIELVGANPAAATAQGAQADISLHMQNFLAAIEARRQFLLESLMVCPESFPLGE